MSNVTDFSDDRSNFCMPNRKIFKFYSWGLRVAPIIMMLCHWYGVYDFHHNPREIILDMTENEGCVVFLYTMAYLFPLMFMMPASYFFHLCWICRIPFVYIMGVNCIRLYYGSWLIRNEMQDADYILILLTIILYAYGCIKNTCSHIRECC